MTVATRFRILIKSADFLEVASDTFGALANYVATNAQIAPSLGRNLSSATTATINLVSPATIFADRLNELDLRLAKLVSVRRTSAASAAGNTMLNA